MLDSKQLLLCSLCTSVGIKPLWRDQYAGLIKLNISFAGISSLFLHLIRILLDICF